VTRGYKVTNIPSLLFKRRTEVALKADCMYRSTLSSLALGCRIIKTCSNLFIYFPCDMRKKENNGGLLKKGIPIRAGVLSF
jgi:hypothetical protein